MHALRVGSDRGMKLEFHGSTATSEAVRGRSAAKPGQISSLELIKAAHPAIIRRNVRN